MENSHTVEVELCVIPILSVHTVSIDFARLEVCFRGAFLSLTCGRAISDHFLLY
jgi:hypothetical protein